MNKHIPNILWIIFLTVLFEGLTVFLRFGLELESTRDTSLIAYFTFGYRIHHSYVGAAMVLLSLFINDKFMIGQWCIRTWGIRVGWALIASDLIHHFLVLLPVLGDAQFHLVYPGWHQS